MPQQLSAQESCRRKSIYDYRDKRRRLCAYRQDIDRQKGRVHTFCAVPGAWHVMGVSQSAGLSLQWFRNNFCSVEAEEAIRRGVDPYVVMDEKAAEAPAGANRLLFLPYLMGERTPHLDPDCRGVFFGLSAIHTRKDMIRAVMEGVTYALKDCYDILREMGVEFSEMYALEAEGQARYGAR